jgi:hypothetical protein
VGQHITTAEFSYNDSVNRSTGQSPFQIVYGMQPRGISELRDSEQTATRSASAEEFTEAMKELHSQVKERLQNSSQEYKRRADQHRRQLQFEVGDLVLAHLRKERFPRGTYKTKELSKKTRRKEYFEYLVKWKNHPVEDASWETEAEIQKHGQTVQELMDRSP